MNRDKVSLDKVVGLLDYVARNGTTSLNIGTVGEFRKVFNEICPEGNEKEVKRIRLTRGLTRIADREYVLGASMKYKNLLKHRNQMGLVKGYTINFSLESGEDHCLNLSSLDNGVRFSFAFDELSGLYLSKPKNPGMPLGKREEVLYVFN